MIEKITRLFFWVLLFYIAVDIASQANFATFYNEQFRNIIQFSRLFFNKQLNKM